ncbi:MAG: TMEM43 family protein [Gammaproteobacteria bacterium]|nr:TMEM43 family protein [Gammaproteobacteria bacterium]MBU1653416.1 TMEM43 family protein [Gammaproteobacteria bacterium]MBU1959721.1 TMEM43 family protein [Gammaproteobacteria bacterium]
MSDSYTETTSRSWGSRIGGSFKGILVGLILFALSFPLLWWNEGRTVERHLALQEGAGLVVSVDSEVLDLANEGKLIHTTGTAITKETLRDPEFGVSVEALQLIRQTSMFQWHERTESKTEKNLGGSETTKTTYYYERRWNTGLIDSSGFRQPEGHENPASLPYPSRTFTASNATLGQFRLTPDQVDELSSPQPLAIGSGKFTQLPQPHQLMGNSLYLGADPDDPRIGDMKITFSQTPAGPASIVAMQQRGGFAPHRPKAGSSILLIQTGLASAEEMFKAAEQANIFFAWLLRLLGFALMFIGLRLILGPLSVLADVVPFIGSIISFSTGTLAFLLALPFTLLTIALAWIFYRPLLAVGLIAAAIGVFIGVWHLKRGKASATDSPTPGAIVDRG